MNDHFIGSGFMVEFDEFGPEKILEVYDARTGMRWGSGDGCPRAGSDEDQDRMASRSIRLRFCVGIHQDG